MFVFAALLVPPLATTLFRCLPNKGKRGWGIARASNLYPPARAAATPPPAARSAPPTRARSSGGTPGHLHGQDFNPMAPVAEPLPWRMTGAAAPRLARLLRAQGYGVRVRRHRAPARG